MSVGAGGGLLAAVRAGRVCRLCSLWAAGSSVRRWCCWRSAAGRWCRWAGSAVLALAWSSARPRHHRAGADPAGDPVQQAAGQAAGRWAKEKGQGRRRGVRCCSGLWSALAAMVPAGCVPVPVVGLICWRCRWAWSALALFQAQRFQLAAFQRHGWRWRCSIRAGFGRLPEGLDSPPNGIERQV